MSDDIYKTVIKYLETRGNNWHFVYGAKVFSAKDLVEKIRRDKKFRAMIVDEVVKTAVDLLAPR